ncbi:glycosyltransferase family 2 protein [Chloroflexota bacterium]
MAESKPLVSIGMLVYNGETHIRQALDSLLAQEYKNFELIISDNASTDRTRDICLEYAVRDERIRYYRNETNMGAIWNGNRVLELSSGEYFMWAAHDDYWNPRYIRLCLEAFSISEDVVLAGALCEGVDSETGEPSCSFPGLSTVGLGPYARLMRVGSMYSGNKGPHGLFYGVYKKSALRAVMPFKKIPPMIDQLLVAELSLQGEFVTIPEKLLFKRVRPVSISLQARARTLGISQLHIWFRYEMLEVMWLRVIFQSDKLTLHERVKLAFWSLGKYFRLTIYDGPLPLLAYQTLLVLWPRAAMRARELWRNTAQGSSR